MACTVVDVVQKTSTAVAAQGHKRETNVCDMLTHCITHYGCQPNSSIYGRQLIAYAMKKLQ